MTDIFISYARSTASQARAVADALRARGYNVWRDDQLPAHKPYAQVIEEHIRIAKAVVVIWSAEAVRSEWVHSEADRGRVDRKLVQLRIDDAPLPMPFDRIECADLTGWNGEHQTAGWRKVVASVAELLGEAPDDTMEDDDLAVPLALPSRPSIAVLPFTNMSDNRAQEFLADGMTEDVITGLSVNPNLFVIARSSTFSYKGKSPSIRTVSRELGVRTVLEGSVRRVGEMLRVTIQLIDARTEAHLWTQAFDRPLAEMFAMQDEITAGVVAALTSHLTHTVTPEVARARPESLEAWELCQRAATQFLIASDAASRRIPEDLLRHAVEKDPSYANAWVALGVAIAYRWLVEPGLGATDHLEEARSCIERGAALAPGDPDVLAGQGNFLIYTGRPREAAPYFERAIAANPNDVLYRANLARVLARSGRPDEALRQMAAVLRLSPRDPLMPLFDFQMSIIHFSLARYAESETCARRALTGRGGHVAARLILACALAAQGRIEEAHDAVREAVRLSPSMDLPSQEYIFRNMGVDETLVASGLKHLALAWPPELRANSAGQSN